MTRFKSFAWPFLTLALAAQQAPAEDALAQELRALLDTPVTVASRKAATLRETPGVVTLITRQEILDGGARDLIDVLRLVPGLDFGTDVQGVVDVGVRGMWGHEGKILLLWDGVEMNETLFGTNQLGNHYPVDQIQRIEIIRGPGSSIYGGYAELGVIKVTTVGAGDRQGGEVSLMNGTGSRSTFHQQVSIMAAGGTTLKLSAGAFAGRGQRSDQGFTDSTGETFNLKGNSDLRPLFFNLGLDWNGLAIRYVGDRYATTQQDYLGVASLRPYSLNFRADNLDARWQWSPASTVTITPHMQYRSQFPWQTTDTQEDPVAGGQYFDIRTTRLRWGLDASWEPVPAFTFMAGLEATRDQARIKRAEFFPGGGFATTGTADLQVDSKAVYGQVQFTGAWANLTLGARFEDQKGGESAFVPRFALTRIQGPWHFKLLFADAFKAPTLENIDLNYTPENHLVPEKTRTLELEVGRQVGRGILSMNLFQTRINHPIVYFVDPSGTQGYSNFGHTGSKGIELTYQTKQAWGYGNLSYSYYRADNDVARYEVPGQGASLLGLANHKATAALGVKLAPGWTLAPTVIYLGRRYGYAWADGAMGLKAFPADLLVNLNLVYRQGPLTASAGVFDGLDRTPSFLQPYNAGHGPLAGPSREVVLKLGWAF